MLDTGLLLGVQIILDGAILCREMGQVNEWERSLFQVVCTCPDLPGGTQRPSVRTLMMSRLEHLL